MSTIWLTRVAIVLRRAGHDGWHALTTVRRGVNVTWSGAPPLLHVQAVIVLRTQMGGWGERGAGGNVEMHILETGRQDNDWLVSTCPKCSAAYRTVGGWVLTWEYWERVPSDWKTSEERARVNMFTGALWWSRNNLSCISSTSEKDWGPFRIQCRLSFILHGGLVMFSAWDKVMTSSHIITSSQSEEFKTRVRWSEDQYHVHVNLTLTDKHSIWMWNGHVTSHKLWFYRALNAWAILL